MCFCNCIRKYLTKVASSHMVMLALGIMTLFLADVGLVFAQSPVVTVANWDTQQRCINWIHGTYDVDTFTRDALPGEVYSFWHAEALRANAILIRSVAYHHTIDPQWDDGFPFCNGISPQFYNIHTARVQGWQGGRGAVMGNVNNRTNDRVTDTGGRVLLQNSVAVGWFTWSVILEGVI